MTYCFCTSAKEVLGLVSQESTVESAADDGTEAVAGVADVEVAAYVVTAGAVVENSRSSRHWCLYQQGRVQLAYDAAKV